MKKYLILGIIAFIILVGVIFFLLFRKREEEKPQGPEKDPTVYEEDDFYLNLIKTVNSIQDNNYLVSPYSIEIALQMLKQGSNGTTLEEFNKVLPDRKIETFTAKDRIGVANALFLKEEYKKYIKNDFTNNLQKNYQADVILDRFTSPAKINQWVNQHTYKMIPKILDEISKDFVLGLANAIAIDVEWITPFDCDRTEKETFTKTNQEKMQVEMMHQTLEGNAYYFETNESKGIILPYKSYNEKGEEDYQEGTSLEFVGILPNTDSKSYIEGLTREELDSIDKNLERVNDDFNVILSIPRFKYHYNLGKFKQVLSALGLNSMFSKEQADFTNIISRKDLEEMNAENLYVSTALHKTYIEFSEKGTKAAAVTYFGLEKATAVMKNPKVVDLTFDRPFVYMIRESETKEILFFGVVEEPNEWKGSTCE